MLQCDNAFFGLFVQFSFLFPFLFIVKLYTQLWHYNHLLVTNPNL